MVFAVDITNQSFSIGDSIAVTNRAFLGAWLTAQAPALNTNGAFGNSGIQDGSFTLGGVHSTFFPQWTTNAWSNGVLRISGTNTSLRVGVTQDVERVERTMMAWVYVTNLVALPDSMGNIGYDGGTTFLIMGNAGTQPNQVWFYANNSGTFSYCSGSYSWGSNQWTHLAVSVTTNHVVSIYSNGVPVALSTSGAGATNVQGVKNYTFSICAPYGVPGTYIRTFFGFIDDARRYNKALTTAEIQSIYTNTKARFGK